MVLWIISRFVNHLLDQDQHLSLSITPQDKLLQQYSQHIRGVTILDAFNQLVQHNPEIANYSYYDRVETVLACKDQNVINVLHTNIRFVCRCRKEIFEQAKLPDRRKCSIVHLETIQLDQI